MSTSKLASFSFSLTPSVGTPNDKLFRKHKFTNHMLSPFEHYKHQLSLNVSELKRKYPIVDSDYIKSLLEQLQNNVQMVGDILQQQEKKTGIGKVVTLMEQQRTEVENQTMQILKEKVQVTKQQQQQPQQQQNEYQVKSLRNSITKLFKKYKQQKQQKQQLLKKVSVLLKQNQNLRLMNRHLMKEEMEGRLIEGNRDIY